MKSRSLPFVVSFYLAIATGSFAPTYASTATDNGLIACLKNQIVGTELLRQEDLSVDVDHFIQNQLSVSTETFLNRFDANGFVAAADWNVNHDYDADWRRDSALAWITKITGWKKGEFKIPKDELIAQIKSRIEFHRKTIQSDEKFPGLNLSEARHDRKGNVIMDKNNPSKVQEWARGQADGTALVASEIALEAQTLIELDPQNGYDYVKTNIFGNRPPEMGVLKKFAEHMSHEGLSHELAYIANGQKLKGAATAEAWEEMFGDHYHTALTQIRGLSDTDALLGKMIAIEKERAAETTNPIKAQEHIDEAKYYQATADYYSGTAIPKLLGVLDRHWITDTNGAVYAKGLNDMIQLLNTLAPNDPRKNELETLARDFAANPNSAFPPDQRNYIVSTMNPDVLRTWHFEKTLQQDAIVISGVVQNYATGETPFIRASDSKMLSTLHALEVSNRRLFPKEAQVNGISPAARYFQDLWQGAPPDVLKAKTDAELRIPRTDIGKPGHYAWTLLTQDGSSIYALLGKEVLMQGQIGIDPINLPFYQDLLPNSLLKANQFIKKGTPIYDQAILAIRTRMDSYATIANETYTKVEKGKNGQPDKAIPVAEGFHPVTRLPQGPENLTWTYTSWFNMTWNRQDFLYQLKKAYPKP